MLVIALLQAWVSVAFFVFSWIVLVLQHVLSF